MKIQIRLRGPKGQTRLEIDDEDPLEDLVDLIKADSMLSDFTLKYGYPLKNLDISPEAQSTVKVKELGLRGETIVVAPLESSLPQEEPKPAQKPFKPKGIEPDETSLEWPERGGYVGRCPGTAAFCRI